MLNHITIMGRLVADPELRRTPKGTAVCTFRIACDRDVKNADGERETDFIDVVAWRGLAENVARYFSKGRMAVLEGRLQIRPGQTVTTCGTTLLRSWPAASTLETASPKAKGAKTATNRLRAAISTRTVSCPF